MPELNLDTAVGDWVAERPDTSRVFETFHIDYCCGGKKPLSQACAERKIDPQSVLAQLHAAVADRPEPPEKWSDASLTALCDHIEQTHHAYLRSELPRLTKLIDRVANVHGVNHPELAQVQAAFDALRAELEPHMLKEERVLFPAIRLLESGRAAPVFPFGTLANPIRVMEQEHAGAGDALAQIRRLTGDFRVPSGACNTYRAMLQALESLEGDMHRHVHKENNILFPKAVELEKARAGG